MCHAGAGTRVAAATDVRQHTNLVNFDQFTVPERPSKLEILHFHENRPRDQTFPHAVLRTVHLHGHAALSEFVSDSTLGYS